MCKASSVLCDLTTMEISNILILFYVGNCKRLRISQLFFIVSVHRSSQPSLSCLFTTFTLTLVRRAASPSRKVPFTQKPVVYPPTFGYSAPPFRRPIPNFHFVTFYRQSHTTTTISSPKPGISPQSVPSIE